MTNEEFRNCVYNQYRCGSVEGSTGTHFPEFPIIKGLGFHSPDRCYEILNERQTNRGYSRYEHYYKIKW